MQTVGDKTLIRGLHSYAWPVRATNYGRWWLQSNRLDSYALDVTDLILELNEIGDLIVETVARMRSPILF